MTQFLLKQRKATKKKPPLLASRQDTKNWKVAVLANLYYEQLSPLDPPDKGGDYDSVETIERICNILAAEGHTVEFIHADMELPKHVTKFKPDICFNIAEGSQGDSREAQVPAFLELMGIPYTGSRVLTNAIALDKSLTKVIWQQAGLPVAPWQILFDVKEALSRHLSFPLIVKPSQEGSGMGLDPDSVVYDETQLRKQVSKIVLRYHQPAMVEKFLPGREFTVCILGHSGANIRRPEFYDDQGFHYLPIMEISVPSTNALICDFAIKHVDDDKATPASLSPEFSQLLYDYVRRGHHAIGALDISRTDIRCDEQGQPYLLEINPLPGLSKNSHIPSMFRFSGIPYDQLILEILYLGAERYGLRR